MSSFEEHERHTVLIVDDDHDVRQALQQLLEEDEYEIYAVENGVDALNILKVIRPCIILTDMRMPKMNGFTLCKKLKENPIVAGIPIVLVTAMVRDEDVQMGIDCGAVDYIKKPFDRYETRMRVMSQIRLHETIVRKEAVERQLSIISRAAKDAIVVIDNNGRISHWNEAAEEMFGYRKSEVMRKNLHALIAPPRYHERFGMGFSEFHKNGTGKAVGKTIELSALRRTGEEFPVELSLSSDKIDGRWHAVGIIRDISDRKLLDRKLLKAQKLESLGQLAAGIAHEINTPTQYIGDNARYLQDVMQDLNRLFGTYDELVRTLEDDSRYEALTEKIASEVDMCDTKYALEESPKSIENIMSGVERISRIVIAMKEFSHPGTKQKKHADINHLLENTITVCFNEYKGVSELTTNFSNDIPMIQCYPVDLNQVFVNLLVNASHAIADAVGDSNEKGHITIASAIEQDEVCISFSDTGIGISPDIQERIFEPFFTTKEIGRGSGQGLSIARSIVVDKHKGTLNFETIQGHGTTFHVRLPLIT